MNGYPLCTMEAYAEAIAKVENMEMRRAVTSTFVGSQGTHKAVQDFLKSIPVSKKDHDDSAEAFLSDFSTRFKDT